MTIGMGIYSIVSGWLYCDLDLPVYPNVVELRIRNPAHFTKLSHFPNLRYLNIDLLEGEQPELPHLDTLVINTFFLRYTRNGPQQCYWPQIHTITTDNKIPEGYINVRHVAVARLDHIPKKLVGQIETIKLKHYDLDIDVTEFTMLQSISFPVEEVPKTGPVIKCAPDVRIPLH